MLLNSQAMVLKDVQTVFQAAPRDRSEIRVSLFSVEALDKLMTRSIADEVKMKAIANARAKCRAKRVAHLDEYEQAGHRQRAC